MNTIALRWLLCASGIPGLFASAVAAAQMPAPLAAPFVPIGIEGSVSAIVRQPDGGIVVGGHFTLVNGVPRSNLARFNADGTLDPDWHPIANGDVKALATNTRGDVYAGGYFTEISSQPRSLVAKLAGGGSGAPDPDWSPSVQVDDDSGLYVVTALALDASGAIYIGGFFHAIAGQPRDFIGKVAGNGRGALDVNWKPVLSSSVTALAIGTDATLFASVDNDSSPVAIAKLSTTGSGAADGHWQFAVNGRADALAVDANGTLYAAGDFINPAPVGEPGYQNRYGLLKFPREGNGSADAGWNPPYSYIGALAVDAAGAVYVGTGNGGNGGIFKLSGSDGSADPYWSLPANGITRAMTLDSGGSVIAGGSFNAVGAQPRLGLVRVDESSGHVGTAMDVELPGEVNAIARQPNGGTIVAGRFLMAGAVPRRNILRLDSTGALDRDWNPSAANAVLALAVDGDSNVYAGGYPTSRDNTNTNAVMKLAGDGTGAADPAWNVPVTGYIDAIAMDSSGAIYVGGEFSAIAGTTRHNIAKLAADGGGTVDPGWSAETDSSVFAIAIAANDSLYIGGNFYTVAGHAHASIARVASQTGAVDEHWQSAVSGYVRSLALVADGSLYVGGELSTPEHSPYAVKLTQDGTLDAHWNAAADDQVYTLAVDNMAGAVYAGGTFTTIGGQRRAHIARLSGDSGQADASWNPATDNNVNILVLDGIGSLYAGGSFTTIGGQIRSGIAALPSAAQPPATRGHSRHARPDLTAPPLQH